MLDGGTFPCFCALESQVGYVCKLTALPILKISAAGEGRMESSPLLNVDEELASQLRARERKRATSIDTREREREGGREREINGIEFRQRGRDTPNNNYI